MRIPLDGGKEEPAREAESPGSAFPSGVSSAKFAELRKETIRRDLLTPQQRLLIHSSSSIKVLTCFQVYAIR
jgi:hypothetical protein